MVLLLIDHMHMEEQVTLCGIVITRPHTHGGASDTLWYCYYQVHIHIGEQVLRGIVTTKSTYTWESK